MKNYVYDIEVFPNVFTMTVDEMQFEISHRRNDFDRVINLLTAIKHEGSRMVGYNNVGYDYPVIHYILTNHPTLALIYNFSTNIINSEDKFGHIIWDRDQYVPQLDLYRIHHFDNKAKQTSLKMLEFNMRSQSIQELPFPPGTVLNDEQIDILLGYNLHDVRRTTDFFNESKKEIAFRDELTGKHGKNFTNYNDVKIGTEIFKMEIEKYQHIPKGGTPRESIPVRDIILPNITFKRPEFQRVLDWMLLQDVVDTKGAFTKVPEYRLGPLLGHVNTRKTRAGYQQAKNIYCTVDGFSFAYGTGGLHGSVSPQIIHTDDEGVILDVDVISFYPAIAIACNLFPAHIGPIFCQVYDKLKKQRLLYTKGTTENKMLKLALNGTFGNTGSPFSIFYDPQYTMAVTINGQLLLSMLADYLMDIPGLKMIQANTDGLTVKCPWGYVEYFRNICEWWEGYTNLDLEEVQYSRMFIRDVNNYVAEYEDGHKKKGAYSDTPEWHKDHSSLVIQKAAFANLVHDQNIEQFIYDHDDPMDFMLRTKVPRSSKLLHGDQQVQNISRYYISNTGKPLTKVMPPLPKNPGKWREMGINVGWLTTICNDYQGGIPDVNYKYYIDETKKLTDVLK